MPGGDCGTVNLDFQEKYAGAQSMVAVVWLVAKEFGYASRKKRLHQLVSGYRCEI